jgi:hypothetical protein
MKDRRQERRAGRLGLVLAVKRLQTPPAHAKVQTKETRPFGAAGVSLPPADLSVYTITMETTLKIDVATLDAPHRRALEDLIGQQLRANQRLVISVMDVVLPQTAAPSLAQTLEEWTGVYDGLTDDEIEDIDRIAKTRANLTRDLP